MIQYTIQTKTFRYECKSRSALQAIEKLYKDHGPTEILWMRAGHEVLGFTEWKLHELPKPPSDPIAEAHPLEQLDCKFSETQ